MSAMENVQSAKAQLALGLICVAVICGLIVFMGYIVARMGEAVFGLRLSLILGVVPAVLCIFVIRRFKNDLLKERRVFGCCLNCGYDLRESPARCPECGTVPAEKIKISN